MLHKLICAICRRPFLHLKKTRAGVPDGERCCSKRCAIKRTRARGAFAEQEYSDVELLEILRERASGEYAPPGDSMFKPCETTYKTRFGSWANAVAAAGLKLWHLQRPLRNPAPRKRTRRALSKRFEILKRDGFTCQYCGGTPQQGYVLHVDHKIPRSKGGTDEPSNLITACEPCNLGKGMTLLVEIATSQEG